MGWKMNQRRLLALLVAVVALSVATSAWAAKDRAEIEDRYKWKVDDIYPSFEAWEADFERLEAGIAVLESMKGTLSEGPQKLLAAYRKQDELGQIAYKVWYYVNLQLDENLRNNEMNARRQNVQTLFAKWTTATAWFDPELLSIPQDTMKGWLDSNLDLALYRFAIEDLYRQQEHVLDESGETLMSYSSRFNSAPADIYAMLTTADVDWPTVTLSTGEEVQVTTGQYYARLETERNQADREAVWRAFFETYNDDVNTYAAIYNGVCQRDWFQAQARGYESTLQAALDGNNIPTQVVETLISEAKAGARPLQRYYELRRKALGLEKIAIYDGYISLVEVDKEYPFDKAAQYVIESVAPLGQEYQATVKKAIDGRWIDVYETENKRSGAYSAGVYGVHPYMLLNYTDTMSDVFTLAHEMGHSMHSVLASETQPFVYSDYTIFVAEVASTLNEALLLDYMLERTDDPKERVALLQHSLDQIALTFYRQICFADFELEAHRMVERGEPITGEVLNELYLKLLRQYYGDGVDIDPLYGLTWARIPHMFRTPYYVYQYATCFASSAKLMEDIRSHDPKIRQQALDRYLDLLRSGGSDHPMELLKKAGVDLSKPTTVRAVVQQMDRMVDQLETELGRL